MIMKKTCIALSLFLIAACSNSDMNGYTDSIIKCVTTYNSSSSSERLNTSSLQDQYSTLEDNLASLDEAALVEKLLNTPPQYLAKQGEEPTTQSSSSNKLINQYDGDILGFNTSDFLKEIDAKTIQPFIEEPANYEFGFDNLPKECYKKNPPTNCNLTNYLGDELNFENAEKFFNFSIKDLPVTYISVAQSQAASADFIPQQITCAQCLYEEAQIIQLKRFIQNYKLIDLSLEEIQRQKENYKETKIEDGKTKSIKMLSAAVPGLYLVVGKTKKRPNSPKGKTNQASSLKGIGLILTMAYPYGESHFTYIQLNGGDSKIENEPNSFTLSRVENIVKDIFMQAVIDLKPQKVDGQEFVSDKKFEKETYYNVFAKDNLLEVDMTEPQNKEFYNNLAIFVPEYIKKTNSNENNIDRFNFRTNAHIVIAINKERKKWNLETCMNSNGNLNNCVGLTPEKEPEGITYKRYGCKTYTTTENAETVKIVKKATGYHLQDADGQEQFNECKGILFTDNGLPVYPGNPLAAAGMFPINKDENKIMTKEGIAIVPKAIGSSGLYTLAHELAHTYGLTDVTATDFYKIKQTNTENGIIYTNDYASTETNLMTWQQPTGKKIRFRGIPIACSQGTIYKDSEDKILGAPLQRSIDLDPQNQKTGDTQWHCLRGLCYKKSNTSEDKKIYFNSETGYCSESERILNNKTKEDYESAKKTIEEKENTIMYINYNKTYTNTEKNNLTIK